MSGRYREPDDEELDKQEIDMAPRPVALGSVEDRTAEWKHKAFDYDENLRPTLR